MILLFILTFKFIFKFKYLDMEPKFFKPDCEQFVKGFDTQIVHAGFYGDQYGSLVPPIVLSSTFKQDFQSKYIYSRA